MLKKPPKVPSLIHLHKTPRSYWTVHCNGGVFCDVSYLTVPQTSALKMMTAEEAVSGGRVEISGQTVNTRQSSVYSQLGYCPQFDTVWPRIRLQEHLQLFARIRGVPEEEIGSLVETYVRALQLEEHAGKFVKDCSGGTKRKLSYGIAMIGNPRIVLLDEPSTGMDPQSKRFV